MITYAVRAHTYRGKPGYHIGSRGQQGGWPISIWVSDRPDAELIRDAYTAHERGHITREEREVYVDATLLGIPFSQVENIYP